MLIPWVLVVILLLAICFLATRTGKLKSATKTVRLGLLTTLEEVVTMLGAKDAPNYETAMRMQDKFGDFFIISFPFLRESTAIISELNLAKKIMSSSDWVNRFWDNHYMHTLTFNKPIGLLFSNGEHWKEARRLSLKILHQLNFYRPNTMEKLMAVEIAEIEEILKAKINETGNNNSVTLSPHQMFEVSTLNIVFQVIMGRRLQRDDPVVHEMLAALNLANREFNGGFSILDVFPWLLHIPKLTFMDSSQRASDVVYEFFKEEMAVRRRAGTYRTQPLDFTDYFLLEIDNKAKECSLYITDECFLASMRDMIAAGMDTTNATLEHAIMHMALNPQIQRKVQAEIDQVVGKQRMPTYSDKNRMPYTQAAILEILRHATPVPIVSRSPLTDNQINGEFLAKGSLVGINVYAIHRSEDLWEDPYEFRPERFLSDAGEIVNAEKIIPFGHGKRLCIGESVARVSLFMFFVSLMQKFTWEVSQSHPPPSLKNIPGLSRCPAPYYVTVSHRHGSDCDAS